MKEEILSNERIKKILDKMDDISDSHDFIFDSHDFIVEFMRGEYKKEYVEGLIRHYDKSDDPIRDWHREIGQALKTQKNDLEELGKIKSLNIRGTSTPNELWRKI